MHARSPTNPSFSAHAAPPCQLIFADGPALAKQAEAAVARARPHRAPVGSRRRPRRARRRGSCSWPHCPCFPHRRTRRGRCPRPPRRCCRYRRPRPRRTGDRPAAWRARAGEQRPVQALRRWRGGGDQPCGSSFRLPVRGSRCRVGRTLAPTVGEAPDEMRYIFGATDAEWAGPSTYCGRGPYDTRSTFWDLAAHGPAPWESATILGCETIFARARSSSRPPRWCFPNGHLCKLTRTSLDITIANRTSWPYSSSWRKRLRTLRAERGWSQADLAERSGVSKVHIARIETHSGTRPSASSRSWRRR